jgi:tRNA G37 N-methylase TrmD
MPKILKYGKIEFDRHQRINSWAADSENTETSKERPDSGAAKA